MSRLKAKTDSPLLKLVVAVQRLLPGDPGIILRLS